MNTATDTPIETTDRATYCPEDNKLRLYVGRVPRPEYEALRADGWTSTPKQSCDFVASWTPARRDTALDYAGVIEDEDQSPAERAVDRAERFAGYRDKRTMEAHDHADRFDAGPSVIGFQSQAKAERAVARFDRVAARAVDSWGKAEYWQSRTAGVISHALHVCSPSVRMGRIKELEADLRRATPGGEWHNHLTLRLAYENQMLEAQGGRAGVVEMVPGGWLQGGRRMGTEWRQIQKVNKSPVSGRVVSVLVRDNHASEFNHYGNRWPDGIARVLSHTVEVERASPDAYRAPTPEELAEFHAKTKAAKKAAKAAAPDPVPLINPTDEDAQRLQDLWNAQAMAARVASYKRLGYSLPVTDCQPSKVLRITQAAYSAHSKGTYCAGGTREVFAGGIECGTNYDGASKLRLKHGREVCLVRRTSGHGQGDGFHNSGSRVIVLTDKPQKPLPAAVWVPVESLETINA
jgi:hypothetical protein